MFKQEKMVKELLYLKMERLNPVKAKDYNQPKDKTSKKIQTMIKKIGEECEQKKDM